MASSSNTATGHEKPSPDSPNDAHSFKRMFIGPMLESDVSQLVSTINFSPDLDNSDLENATGLTRFIYQNAKEFFLRRGGREEDWGDASEYREGELVLTKWLASEWGRIYRSIRRKKTRSSKGFFMSGPYLQPWTNFNWVGSSFEVGDFMGVNVLTKTLSHSPRSQRTQSTSIPISRTLSRFSDASAFSSAPPSPSPLPSSMRTAQQTPFLSVSAASKASSYMTAPSYASPATRDDNFLKPPSTEQINDLIQIPSDNSATSNTPLLPSTPPRSALHLPSDRLKPERIPSNVKQSRSVYFSIPESPRARRKKNRIEIGVEAADVDDNDTNEFVEPAPPNEVLARTGSEVDGASAGATIDSSQLATDRHDGEKRATVQRDRMLVRISLAVKGNVGRYFTEDESRSAQGLIYRDLAEFLVIFRDQRVELYNDYKLPLKERILGHKRLAHTIPLLPTTTHLSLFSSVDHSFCLVYTPKRSGKSQKEAQRHILKFFTRVNVSYIFIFRPKSRSRAVDWMWRLWSALDGKLPQSMLIHNPLLENSVQIPIPSFSSDNTNSYDNFMKDSLISTCLQMLNNLPHWENILSLPVMKGKKIELCWRTESKLDWVWLEYDEDGLRRDWAILFGLALKIPKHPSYLELRVAEHYYTHVILRDGSYLHEPPGIEGYVYRIGSNNSKTLLYLTTHDNYLFELRPSHAHPPEPPGIAAAAVGAGKDGDTDIVVEKNQISELTRGRKQIVDSNSFLDLRNVIAVRRAFQPIEGAEQTAEPIHTHLGRSRNSVLKDLEGIFQIAEIEAESDGDDLGGDEFLSKTTDKAALRMRRMFEFVLLSGNIIKLEVHSCKDAIEWINRLRQLIFYWTMRYRDDVEAEMEIVRSSEGGQSIGGIIKRLQKPMPPPPPPDPANSSHLLGRFWNWCVLEGCRPIVKCGPLYVKTKFRAQYQYSQLFLLCDRLVQFHLTRRRRQRHRRIEIISLLDMYVSSGHYAALSLPNEEYQPGAPPVSKFYRDGLETSDIYEDTLFALWYRSDKKSGDDHGDKIKKVPSLSAKKKLLICRARSRLERDVWCWAINCQIEKLARINVGTKVERT